MPPGEAQRHGAGHAGAGAGPLVAKLQDQRGRAGDGCRALLRKPFQTLPHALFELRIRLLEQLRRSGRTEVQRCDAHEAVPLVPGQGAKTPQRIEPQRMHVVRVLLAGDLPSRALQQERLAIEENAPSPHLDQRGGGSQHDRFLDTRRNNLDGDFAHCRP